MQTIEEFRNNDLYRNALADLLKSDILRVALAVCDAASPANGGVKVWEQPHMAHIQLGVDRGYNLYPQILRMLATRAKPPETQIEPSYEQPPLEETESWTSAPVK